MKMGIDTIANKSYTNAGNITNRNSPTPKTSKPSFDLRKYKIKP